MEQYRPIVRTAPIKSNSLNYPFSIPFKDEFELNTSDFDLSQTGRYRIRVSVAENKKSDMGAADTIYGYFSVNN